MLWRFVMLACMITSTVNLIPWVIPKVDGQVLGQRGHCNNLLGKTTSVDMEKIQEISKYTLALYDLWKTFDDKKEMSGILNKMPRPKQQQPHSQMPQNN